MESNRGCLNDIGMIATIWLIMMSIVWLLSGCKVCDCIPETIEVEKTTTIHHRDTTFVTKADSASMVALLECDSNYNVVLNDLSIANGDRLELEARIKRMQNGQSQIVVDCKEDSLRNRIEWLEKEYSEKKSETITIREQYMPPFAKFCIWYFFITLIGGIVIVAVKLYLKFV